MRCQFRLLRIFPRLTGHLFRVSELLLEDFVPCQQLDA